MNNNLLISVRPKFAARILAGEKTVELRKLRPKVSSGDNLIFYISSPDKNIKAISKINKIINARLDLLWETVKDDASVTHEEFMEYFEGKEHGYAIYFSKIEKLENPIKLENIKEIVPGFTAPQSFRYFSQAEMLNVLSIGFVN